MKCYWKITLLIVCFVILLSSEIFAMNDLTTKGKDWISLGKQNAGTTIDTSNLISTSDTIYNILLAVGVGAAVIIGAILGIQFMTAGVDKKVEVKKALIPYIISCIIVFGSFGIWKVTVQVLKGIEPVSTTSSSSSGGSTSGSGYGGGGRKLWVKVFNVIL